MKSLWQNKFDIGILTTTSQLQWQCTALCCYGCCLVSWLNPVSSVAGKRETRRDLSRILLTDLKSTELKWQMLWPVTRANNIAGKSPSKATICIYMSYVSKVKHPKKCLEKAKSPLVKIWNRCSFNSPPRSLWCRKTHWRMAARSQSHGMRLLGRWTLL